LSDKELDVLLKLSNTGAEAKLLKLKEPTKDLNIEDSAEEILELSKAKDLKDGLSLYGLEELKEIEKCNLEE